MSSRPATLHCKMTGCSGEWGQGKGRDKRSSRKLLSVDLWIRVKAEIEDRDVLSSLAAVLYLGNCLGEKGERW